MSLTGFSSPGTYTGSDGVVTRTGGQVFWRQEYNRQHQNESYALLNQKEKKRKKVLVTTDHRTAQAILQNVQRHIRLPSSVQP